MTSAGRAWPLVLRVAVGDVVAARASLVVVSHFNGLRPAGATAAVDAAIGGAIARRAAAGALESHFGAGHFIPAVNALLAADAVLVLGLGEPGKFDAARLPELGAAMVDAATTAGARDLATVIHGAGGLNVSCADAARELGAGLLRAVAAQGECELREVLVVVRDEDRADEVRRALHAAPRPAGLDVVVEPASLRLPERALTGEPTGGEPERRLHLGAARVGDRLKVMLITDAAYDATAVAAYPTDAAVSLLADVRARIVDGASRASCARALRALGREFFDTFLGWTELPIAASLAEHRGDCVLLRLDESTVDLPWELALPSPRAPSLSRGWLLARQREISAPAHAAAYVPEHDTPRALVIGDPLGDLPGARDEAAAVADKLRALGAEVRVLGAGVRRADVFGEFAAFDPDVLHYAGHARFDPLRQEAGGLVLADGCLTGGDLLALPRIPRVFFANGCTAVQTGDLADQRLSDGSASTHDFAGGVLRAGARALIGSQWVVADDPARRFAEAFYEALIAPGAVDRPSVGSAVLAARTRVADDCGEGESAWAAYALYGAPWKPAF